MRIIGKKIDVHNLDNHEQHDTHAGFTTGGMIEDYLPCNTVFVTKKGSSAPVLSTAQTDTKDR